MFTKATQSAKGNADKRSFADRDVGQFINTLNDTQNGADIMADPVTDQRHNACLAYWLTDHIA